MQTVQIQNNAWDTYNDRKHQNGQDPNCFIPEELWEFDYLVKLIQEAKPQLDQLTVILAMREGMRRTVAPRPRHHFVDLVLNNIREREDQWTILLESMGQGVSMTPGSLKYPFTAN